MQHQWDLIVIGGGPSGLNAASTAAENGLEVMLIDEQKTPGGQIYRKLSVVTAENRFLQADDRKTGLDIINRFFKSGAHYAPETIIWFAEPGRTICSHKGKSREIKSQYMVVATGAMERPVPFAGWTLPGVMGAGASDILYKDASVTPPGPVVIAGNGPLIPLVSSHLLSLGVEIAAILDMAPFTKRLTSLGALPRAMKDMPFLLKGAGMMKKLYLSKIPIVHGVTQIAAHGNQKLASVSCITPRKTLEFEVATLLFHHGVIPRTHMSRMLRLEHAWDSQQRYWYPKTDDRGMSSNEKIYVIGDNAFVHGADVSALKGIIAGIEVSLRLNMISNAEASNQYHAVDKNMNKLLAPRAFVDNWFAPDPKLYKVDDDVIVCRCERVRAGDIRMAVEQGCHEVNEIKIRTRCGMGNCQGRMCGPAVAEIAAEALGTEVPQVGSLKIRPPVRPIPFGQICDVEYIH